MARAIFSISSSSSPGASAASAARDKSIARQIRDPGQVFLTEDEENPSPISYEPSLGAFPGSWVIDVAADVDEALQQMRNPVKLSGRGLILGSSALGAPDLTSFSFDDMWLSDRMERPSRGRPDIVRWRIEDNRRWARSLVSHGGMNIQRLANEFKDFPDVKADGNFAQFHRIPKFSYLLPTTEDANGGRFAPWNSQNFKAWTAFEAVQFMLGPFFEQRKIELPTGRIFQPKIILDGALRELENGFPLQNYKLEGAWPIVVSRLFRLAHLSMAPTASGAWRVFRLDPKKIPRQIGGFVGGGFLLERDRSRARAKKHRTVFKTRWNFRVNAVENVPLAPAAPPFATVVDAPPDDNPFPMVATNVLLNPFDITDPATGKLLRRGTVQSFERMIPIWNAAGTAVMPSLFIKIYGGLSFEVIKKWVVGPGLASFLSVEVGFANQRHPKGAAIARVIYEFYRRLWQIRPEVLDFLDPRTIRASSSDVADTRTGKSSPSRLYFDHTMVFTYFGSFPKKLAPSGGAGFMTINPWPVGAAESDRTLDSAEASDYARVRVFDPNLGLFLLTPLTDIAGTYGRVLFTTFSEFSNSNIVGAEGIPMFLENATQHDEWRASWVFSAGLLNGKRKNFFVVEADFGGEGPPLERRMYRATASMPWNDISSRAIIGSDGQLELDGFHEPGGSGNEPQNAARLMSIAAGQKQIDEFQWQDWPLGSFAAPGFDPAVDRPQGNYRVALVYENGYFRAEYQFTQPRSAPIYESLSKDAADLLFRLDEDR